MQCLLVDAGGLRHSNDTFLLDARWNDVRHGLTAAVLIDTDSRDVEGGLVADVVGLIFARSLNALRVGAPFAFHKVEGGKTQNDGLLKLGHKHTHEADAGIVVDAADDLVGLPDGDAELIPCNATDLSVGQCHTARLKDVGDMVLTNDHLGRVEVDFVLVVTLRLAQGIVAVDVFSIGQGGVAAKVAIGLLNVGGRVTVGTVEALVTG